MPGLVVFKPFDSTLKRAGFDCGNTHINHWFHHHAGQAERRNEARTHLGLATFDSQIASFYTLVVHEVSLADAHKSAYLGSRRYPVPAMLIAQLGVDNAYQGKGIGRQTLAAALERLLRVSEDVGFELVLVDAIDDAAARFYKKHGFRELVEGGERLFITMKQLTASSDASA